MFQKIFILLSLSILIQTNLFSQKGGIKGVISDSKTEEFLIGANILIQGTDLGTSTDLDGSYVLQNISPGDYNLVFSYTSYKTQIVRVTIIKDEVV